MMVSPAQRNSAGWPTPIRMAWPQSSSQFAGWGGGDQSPSSMSHRTLRATNSPSPELVITHSILPLGEAKWENSRSTSTTAYPVSGAAFAADGLVCAVGGAALWDRLSEELVHPASAVSATRTTPRWINRVDIDFPSISVIVMDLGSRAEQWPDSCCFGAQ